MEKAEKNKPKAPYYMDAKKAHKDSITSIDVSETNDDLIATSSDDKTIRLWDLRLNYSIKQLVDPEFKQNEMSNLRFSKDSKSLFQSCGNSIYEFDIRIDKVLIKQAEKIYSKTNNDEINHIQVDDTNRYICACDDLGEIKIIDTQSNSDNNVIKTLKGVHQNITFTCDFINPGKKPYPYCISSGFDCILAVWDLEKESIFKKTNLLEIAKKQIEGQLLSPPLVYNVTAKGSTILASVETGHIMAFNYKELNKAKYIIDGHLGRVIRSAWCRYDENMLISVSTDLSFALWDISKRDLDGCPIFLRRVAISEKPNWIETTKSKKILVGDTSPDLYIYYLKE